MRRDRTDQQPRADWEDRLMLAMALVVIALIFGDYL